MAEAPVFGLAPAGVLTLLPLGCSIAQRIDIGMVTCLELEIQDIREKTDSVLRCRQPSNTAQRWGPARLDHAEFERKQQRSRFVLRHGGLPHYPERARLLQLLHDDDLRLDSTRPQIGFEFEYALTLLEDDAIQVGLSRERLLRLHAENPLLNPRKRPGTGSFFNPQRRDLQSRKSRFELGRRQILSRLDLLSPAQRVLAMRRIDAANTAASRLQELEVN
jgi:hypothetical protein